MRRTVFSFTLLTISFFSVPGPAADLQMPLKLKSVRFAVIGDSGTGKETQTKVAVALEQAVNRHNIRFVIMTGDTVYHDSGGSGDKNPRPDRALADVFWALLNSSEFILNH